MTEDNIYRQGSAETSGFIVEWRLKEKIIMITERGQLGKYPTNEWGKAPYDIEEMRFNSQTSRLIRPIINDSAFGYRNPHSISNYGLVDKLTADAIIACFRTMVRADSALSLAEEHIEFRARLLKLNYNFKLEKAEEE